MSVSFSTICGTGRSRICTNGQTEVLPGLRRVVQNEPLPRPCPSSVLVRSGACTRTGPFAPTASRGEPTVAVGRSLLRRAAPSPAGSRSLMATARDTDKRNEAHTLVFWLALCCVALVVVVVVVVVQMIKATACLSMRVPTCSKFKGNTELQLADSVRDLSLQRQIPGV